MAYSQVEFTYTGGPQVFPTNFALGVLEADHIVVNVDGQVDGFGDPINFAFTYNAGTGEVTVTDPLTSGWTGSIRRITPVDSLIVNFEANADVTKRNLSRSTKQVLMVVQELTDSREADSTAIQETQEIVTELQESIADDLATIQAALVDAEAAAAAAAASAAEAEAKENSMLRDRGAWVTATLYDPSDIYTFEGRSYITQVSHTSTTVAGDLGLNRVRIFADKGAAGAGAGDMLAANNLSDLADKPASLATIGGQPLNSKLTDLSALTLTDGDILYVDGTGDLAVLPIGADDEVLTAVAGLPAWATPPDNEWVLVSASSTWTGGIQTITGLGSYSEVMILGDRLSASVSGRRRVRVGAGSILSGAIYARATDAALQTAMECTTSSTAERSFVMRIHRFNTTEAAKPVTLSGDAGSITPTAIISATAMQRIQVLNESGNITGGTLYVWAKR